MGGSIVKINRHKREATVRVPIMGRSVDVTMGIEITSKL